MSLNNKKILIITSCSAKKKRISKPLRAIDLYQGNFFKKVKKFALLNHFELNIISAKYGLLAPDKEINYYDMKIKNNDDIENLKPKVIPKLKNLIKNYDKILLLMGSDYKKIIESVVNEKFIQFFDKRGLGGYLSLMNELLQLNQEQLNKLLFKQNLSPITAKLIKSKYKFKKLI